MKMTMHIDEETLAEVVRITGVASKTKAVEVTLRELVRKSKFKRLAKAGIGLTSEELKDVWEDPFPVETLRAAEEAPANVRKRPRR